MIAQKGCQKLSVCALAMACLVLMLGALAAGAQQITGTRGSPDATTTIDGVSRAYTFDIGADTGTPVDDKDYRVPFKFTGKIVKLTIALDEPKLTPEDVKKLKEAEAKAADSAPKHMQRGPY